jgi:hypothetical protein
MSPDYDPAICKKVDVSACTSQGRESFSNAADYTPLIVGIILLLLVICY